MKWQSGSKISRSDWGIVVLFLTLVFLFLFRSIGEISVFQFGDETEKFVAANLIVENKKIYEDFFAHHGPTPYIVAHIYALLFDGENFEYSRGALIILALIAAAAIYFSPIFNERKTRLLASATFLGGLSSIWTLQGIHILSYQSIAGFAFIVALHQLCLPALLQRKITRGGAFASGLAISSACFSAYAMGPSAILLTMSAALAFLTTPKKSTTWRLPAAYFAFGNAAIVLLITLWLHNYGDLAGYYVYHFYFNQSIYSEFINYKFTSGLADFFHLSLSKERLTYSLFVALFILCSAYFTLHARRPKKSILYPLLLFFGVLLLNPRGMHSFQANAFILAALALAATASSLAVHSAARHATTFKSKILLASPAIILLVTEASSWLSLSTPYEVEKKDFHLYKEAVEASTSAEYRLIREITNPEDKVLALVFHPIFYVQSDRMPASGHYYYLPWQAAYEKAPIAGRSIDICEDLTRSSPKVVYYDHWIVWDRYDIRDYEPCIERLLKSNYSLLTGNIYLQTSLIKDHQGTSRPTPDWRMLATAPLNRENEIPIKLSHLALKDSSTVKTIAIRFGTHNRINKGTARLSLYDAAGNTVDVDFRLADIQDNQFHYFNLPQPLVPRKGVIRSLSGEGISTWEAHDITKIHEQTCVVYIYSDDSYRPTAGCPLY